MKKCYASAVLALLFLCIGKIGHSQNGYIRFVDKLEDVLIAAHNGSILRASSLVVTDLSKLNVRRLVHPEHEVVYLQKGYDLNKDKILNELDGFESVDGEKFSPWNDYIETIPCGEKESIYLELRALQKDSTPIYLQKMLTLADKTAPSVSCKPSIKVYLNAQDTSLKVYAQDLLAGKAYDDCRLSISPRDTTVSPEVKKFSIMYGWIDFLNPIPTPRPNPDQTYLELDCTYSGEIIPLRVFAWDAAGNLGVCASRVEVIDTSFKCIQERPFRFHDSLELFLRHHFTLGRPLVPTAKLLFVKDTLHVGKIRVRRSIRKSNVAPWLTLGYDLNKDGLLNEQDGIDLNQDGDKTDEGEYFVEKGNFIWTPFLDSLPLFCTDFGDSLCLEGQSMGSIFSINQCIELSRPNFFVDYHFGVSKILKATPESTYDNLQFEGLTAQTFLNSPFYTCLTGNTEPDFWGRAQLSSSINVFNEKVDSSIKAIKLECCHANRVVLLNIHAWSKQVSTSLGNILVYAEIFDEGRYCPSEQALCGSPRIILGKISDQAGLPIIGGMVKIDGADETLENLMVSNDGTFYYFNAPWGVPRSNYYLVTPSKTSDPLNGVSTFDLIQIQKHILNLKPFDSPFQYIAADVNRSGSVSTLDVIQLRKLILGIDAKFSNNSSWRFVDANHIFQNPNEPFKTYLPEKVRVGPLDGTRQVGFIGIKIGDVNFSANPQH